MPAREIVCGTSSRQTPWRVLRLRSQHVFYRASVSRRSGVHVKRLSRADPLARCASLEISRSRVAAVACDPRQPQHARCRTTRPISLRPAGQQRRQVGAAAVFSPTLPPFSFSLSSFFASASSLLSSPRVLPSSHRFICFVQVTVPVRVRPCVARPASDRPGAGPALRRASALRHL